MRNECAEALAVLGELCAYCGEPAEGNHTIERDGFGRGPEVPLCDACGRDSVPTLVDIWERIRRD